MGAFPDFFILGAPKCGTTALADWLGAHPRAFVCDPKEPRYWCSDFPALRDEFGLHALPDYLRLFDAASPETHLAVGEGSTIYLRSAEAAPAILAAQPEARFVVMLRDPVEAAHALHMERRLNLREDVEDFETAWRAGDDRAQGRRIPAGCPEPMLVQYRRACLFGEQMRALFDAVPRERVLVHLFDELKSDPAGVYARTLAHLGLPHDGRADFATVNAARARRAGWIARAVLDPPRAVAAPVNRLRMHLIERRYPAVERLKKALSRPARRTPIPPALRAEMRAAFAEDTRLLEEALGRPVPWGAGGAEVRAAG